MNSTCLQEGPTPALLCATLRAKAKAGLLPASPQAAPAQQEVGSHQEVGSPEADAAVEAATTLPRRRLRALANLLELSAPGKRREEADGLKVAAAQLAGGSCEASRPLVMLGRKAGEQSAQQAEVSCCCCWERQLDGCCGRTGHPVIGRHFYALQVTGQAGLQGRTVQQQSAWHFLPAGKEWEGRLAQSGKGLAENCTTCRLSALLS